MTPTERERIILADMARDHQPLRGPNQTTSILPAVVPPWALKLIIVTAIVLWLAL